MLKTSTCVNCNIVNKLKKALIDLVGSSTEVELEGMLLVLRAMPGNEQEKIAAINAIQALLEIV